jgi:beta-glucosidase
VSEAIIAGLDLEMPGPPRWRTGILAHVVYNRKIFPPQIDDRVRGVLGAVKWATEHSGISLRDGETELNLPEHRELIRKVSAESIVLLKNDSNVLPWTESEIKKLAVIGPNAAIAAIHGGGSVFVRPYYKISPLSGLRNALQTHGVEVNYAPGIVSSWKRSVDVEELINSYRKPGFDVRFYDFGSGKLVTKISLANTSIQFPRTRPEGAGDEFRAVISAVFAPEIAGTYEFSVQAVGKAKLFIDEKLVLDTSCPSDRDVSDDGVVKAIGYAEVTREPYDFRIEFETNTDEAVEDPYLLEAPPDPELNFSWRLKMDASAAIQEAVKVASEADHVVIFAGLNVSLTFQKLTLGGS